MYREFYADSSFLSYALVAFLFFFVLFIVIFIQVLRSKSEPSRFDAIAHLPLEEDPNG
ncbi:MAG: CcoQ/FixQ family Cbb3-type cytochrome c oxidase assembly chaperone [Myxococcaceae bacterium]|nr:CcoQ/FixQ family Cbb3-type cytochrome c oxidase assembly chaperone [Myxococcaceae bacterium]MBH2006074.1 CcoQ/FixQ family Cbb3-type cytochrome c oxidase assembly chaperone [Myxococcaceae bacterium]